MYKSISLRIATITFLALFLFGGLLSNVQAQETFEDWKEGYLNEFKEFQNRYDKEFHQTLQKEWRKFAVKRGSNFYERPKLNTIPKAQREFTQEPATTISLDKGKKQPAPTSSSEDTASSTNDIRVDNKPPESGLTLHFEPKVKKAKIATKQINYFGIPIRYSYYAAYEKRIQQPIGKEVISAFWKHLSTKDYPSFLKQLKQVKRQLTLNDYGYAQLLHNIGEQIYGAQSREATLFTWFMLTQSGFGTRVAYNKQDIYLLIKTEPGIFKTTYFKINGTKYYGLRFDSSTSDLPSRLYTYQKGHPKSQEKGLSLFFPSFPLLPKQQQKKTLSFTYRDTTYNLEIPVNRQAINYLKNYPKGQLDLYLNSKMDRNTHSRLLTSLQPLIEGKSELEKTNILLRFVQNAFAYQTDQDQFGSEKKMFPAETLYYPASDCDDRSILFAYLIEHLTDLEYIVLRYPGHLTPAVHFPGNPPSGKRIDAPITYKGNAYYITDPTYYYADAGMIMSKYRDTTPKEIFDPR